MSVFQQIVNVVAYSLSILTFMSPIPSLYQSWRRRDLGELSLVPLAAMAVNSFMWMAYAWLADSIFPLLATFACGETFSIAYIVVYVMLTSNKRRATTILATSVSVVAVVSIYIALARSGVTNQSRDSTATTVGVIANIGSLVMYSSPFETIVRVVRTKNASSMPIHLCLVGAIGNSVWVLYALLTLDVIVLIPNVICSLVGWVQVIVYWIYRPGRLAVDGQKMIDALDSPVKSVAIVVEKPEPKGVYSEIKSPSTAA